MNTQRSETEFVEGLRLYPPNERAPDYIIFNGDVDIQAMAAWCARHSGESKVRIVGKRSQGGKFYAAVDTYRRDAEPRPAPVPNADRNKQDEFIDDQIPF